MFKLLTRAQAAIEKDTPGATIVPVLVSTDKTQLTQFRNKSAYPIYMTIGNIPKEIRRKTSLRAYLLLGYLPTTKLEQEKNKFELEGLLYNCVVPESSGVQPENVSGLGEESWRSESVLLGNSNYHRRSRDK